LEEGALSGLRGARLWRTIYWDEQKARKRRVTI